MKSNFYAYILFLVIILKKNTSTDQLRHVNKFKSVIKLIIRFSKVPEFYPTYLNFVYKYRDYIIVINKLWRVFLD